MGDDWRLWIDLHEQGPAHSLIERLEASELEHDLEAAFHDRIVVSRDGAEVFCYAGTREQAERAEQLIAKLGTEHGWGLESRLERWHETAEQWEDPEVPLPQGDADRAAERAALMAQERAEAQARGYPEFEVRVQLPSHRDAQQLVEKLREEGVPSVHRWKFLLIGASDEEIAGALADRLRAQAPAGSTVTVEGTSAAANAERPVNPFAIMGGLGG